MRVRNNNSKRRALLEDYMSKCGEILSCKQGTADVVSFAHIQTVQQCNRRFILKHTLFLKNPFGIQSRLSIRLHSWTARTPDVHERYHVARYLQPRNVSFQTSTGLDKVLIFQGSVFFWLTSLFFLFYFKKKPLKMQHGFDRNQALISILLTNYILRTLARPYSFG